MPEMRQQERRAALVCLYRHHVEKERVNVGERVPTLIAMGATVEMHNTGNRELQRDVVAIVEHVLADRPGDWRVSIVGSRANDRWEMKIVGPNAFERSYTLEGSAGEHDARVIGGIVSRMVAGRS